MKLNSSFPDCLLSRGRLLSSPAVLKFRMTPTPTVLKLEPNIIIRLVAHYIWRIYNSFHIRVAGSTDTHMMCNGEATQQLITCWLTCYLCQTCMSALLIMLLCFSSQESSLARYTVTTLAQLSFIVFCLKNIYENKPTSKTVINLSC